MRDKWQKEKQPDSPGCGVFPLLKESDLSGAMALKEAAGWNQTEDDWRTFLKLAPDADATPAPGPAAAPTPENLQRGGRVEFDGRLVQGQTAKSGAIYLFARQRTDLRSMVRERQEYRKELLRSTFPPGDEAQ